jgi:hypothetical protein
LILTACFKKTQTQGIDQRDDHEQSVQQDGWRKKYQDMDGKDKSSFGLLHEALLSESAESHKRLHPGGRRNGQPAGMN